MEVTYSIKKLNIADKKEVEPVMEKNLSRVKTGSTVTVVKVAGMGALRKRLMEMGITKGVSIRIRKIAPLGDPIQITLRGYELSLRKAEAVNVIVKE